MPRIMFSAALLCSCLCSCSLLFDASPSDRQIDDDAGFDDDASDAATSLCATSSLLEPSGTLLNVTRGQALDIDRDGLDDIILIAEGSGRPSEAFVHWGQCPIAPIWDYQRRWLLEGPADPPLLAPLVPHVFALAEGRSEPDRLVLIGESSEVPWLTSYPITDGEPSLEPDFAQAMPAHTSNNVCRDAHGPSYLLSGNFDDDMDPTKNDLAVFSGQGWIYDVAQWNSAPAWDVSCANDVLTGTVPAKYSGPGDRFGYIPVAGTGSITDEFVDARDTRLDWRYDGGSSNTPRDWPSAPVNGVALSRLATVDDGLVDAVAWIEGTPLTLFRAFFANDGARGFNVGTSSIDVGATPPTAGAIVEVAEKRPLLLLSGNTLRLIRADDTPIVLSEVILGFQPGFFLTPNWGQGGQVQVLVFNRDDAVFECYDIDGTAQLVACSMP